jgi:hypothetical protein
MTKISISVLKANGQTTKVDLENGDPIALAKTVKAMGLDIGSLTRNGGELGGEVGDGDVVVEAKSAKGA